VPAAGSDHRRPTTHGQVSEAIQAAKTCAEHDISTPGLGQPLAADYEKSFRMAKSDLQAGPSTTTCATRSRPHLTVVFAALAVSRWIEHQTGRSFRKFMKTARRYRTIQIQAGPHLITAADPLPGELRQAHDQINRRSAVH
jgi:hypothetical protein